ncbi:hypothetical protein CDAR_219721 [Caerostris darwini]|uniref:Uncharacterized protein n=1 Tax=Caerostris darwini TaxID=1538125 RepID=A0AAV4WZL0_9ARAC|nr:hypothetical protein CDAR_219721 [Caerostris darwini]
MQWDLTEEKPELANNVKEEKVYEMQWDCTEEKSELANNVEEEKVHDFPHFQCSRSILVHQTNALQKIKLTSSYSRSGSSVTSNCKSSNFNEEDCLLSNYRHCDVCIKRALRHNQTKFGHAFNYIDHCSASFPTQL